MTQALRDEWPPRGRTIGVVYLLYFVVASLGPALGKGLVHAGDAAATASAILAHRSLYQAAFAADLVGNGLYIALLALLFRLFAPVSRSLSSMAAFFGLVGCAVQICGGLLRLAPLVILDGTALRPGLSPAQLQAAALISLELYRRVFDISFVLFGIFDLLLGYLILRSAFLPRFLGAWMMAAGVGWLVFLWPPLAARVSYASFVLGGLAELALMLWLLVKGVDVSAWSRDDDLAAA